MIDIERILERMKNESQPLAVRAYTALHWQSGCRISDLLLVDFTSISLSLNISILQGKGSQALSIQPVYYRDYWKQVREMKMQPMKHYNRFYFYRVYKRFGIHSRRCKGKNDLVTHAFRKNLADDLYQLDNNEKRVQGGLGHRSSASSRYYIDKKK